VVNNIPLQYKNYGGVYRIDIGNICYYGATQRSLSKRYKEHVNSLNKGIHKNKNLQQMYNDNNSIKFTVLLISKSKSYYPFWIERLLINKTDNCNILRKVKKTMFYKK
tara:strand:+ start:224 stop:547 length:324 start_codon:yes stop_codon:yes gene_type:complete